jgi:alpha-L-arabinofuranosidase
VSFLFLTSSFFKNNSKNIISLENTSETFFNNFPIKLDTHIPNVGTGPAGDYVYIDQTTGNLIINVINMQADEQVEVQIMVSGNLLDDTIY